MCLSSISAVYFGLASAGSVVKMSPPVTLPESISLRDRDRPELDELDVLQPVDLLEPEEARDALVALGVAAVRQVRHLLQVGDRLQAVLLRRLRQDREGVRVEERRLPEHGVAALLLERLRRHVRRRGRLQRRLHVGDVEGEDAGVLRIEVDLPARQRRVDQLGAADVLLVGDLEALRLERLLVELAEDERLGEVLRADGDRRRRGRLRVRRSRLRRSGLPTPLRRRP